ncbi:hypothetical protein BC629DRAFT_928927 [Irpex lacteus]|nr:hypothetical protein BC629DRAFT_928927 [Irpex lacteus]
MVVNNLVGGHWNTSAFVLLFSVTHRVDSVECPNDVAVSRQRARLNARIALPSSRTCRIAFVAIYQVPQ